MKITPTLLLFPFFLGAALSGAEPANPLEQLKFTWADPADPAIAEIRQTGESVIQTLGSRMITEVNQVLAAKGAEEAVDLLHLKNAPIPATGAGKPVITAFKRTSLKVRNPLNAPDSADLAALLSIEKDLMDGNSPPKVLVQRVEATATMPAEWRVYRPISVMSSCIVCHGPVDSLLPSVKAKLARLYPEDKAFNYGTYDWRGVLRVSVLPAAAVKKP